jgi:hypothetical protein
MPLQTKAIAGGSNARETTRPVSAKARELLNDQSAGRAVWIRPPKQGVEFYTGLSRAKLYSLASEGKIVTRSLRDPGAIKGTRLFLLQSVLDYIEQCGQEVTEETVNA